MVSLLDVFVVVSGTISVVSSVPLVYLALRGHWEARAVRVLQHESAALLQRGAEAAEEIRELQRQIESRQRETAARVDQVRTLVEQGADVPDLPQVLSGA